MMFVVLQLNVVINTYRFPVTFPHRQGEGEFQSQNGCPAWAHNVREAKCRRAFNYFVYPYHFLSPPLPRVAYSWFGHPGIVVSPPPPPHTAPKDIRHRGNTQRISQ